KPRHAALTPREYEIMCLIAAGKTLNEIAGTLNLCLKTISTNNANILKKMKMASRAELTYYAIKNELVD
ncbi:MAG: LuxR C-terminal-related transcriptional regulator, partial [bacterium]